MSEKYDYENNYEVNDYDNDYKVGRFLKNLPPEFSAYDFITKSTVKQKDVIWANKDLLSTLLFHIAVSFTDVQDKIENFADILRNSHSVDVFKWHGDIVELESERTVLINTAKLIDHYVAKMVGEVEGSGRGKITEARYRLFVKSVLYRVQDHMEKETLITNSHFERSVSWIRNGAFQEDKVARTNMYKVIRNLLSKGKIDLID